MYLAGMILMPIGTIVLIISWILDLKDKVSYDTYLLLYAIGECCVVCGLILVWGPKIFAKS